MDVMTRADERMDSEAHAAVNKWKAEAMQMIEEMPDTAFLKFWERHGWQMDEAATQSREELPF